MIEDYAKAIFNKLGYKVMRNHPGFRVEWTPDVPQAISVLDLLVRLELSRNADFNLIQIGANDGIMADPIHHMIKRYSLKGMLIEPIPDIFERLKANYAFAANRLQFLNIAITTGEGEGDIPFFVFSSPDQAWRQELSRLSSTSRSKLEHIKASRRIEEKITEIAVRYESVGMFIKKRMIESISLLVTDLEGFDISIVTEFWAMGSTPGSSMWKFWNNPTRR